jgi:CheY-like chemotaxis protein
MGRLLDDLLDISRISSGRLELRKEFIGIARILQMAIETAQPNIDRNCHELVVELPAEQIIVDGDPVRLVQAFSNLINNAAKYTPHSGQIVIKCFDRGPDAYVGIIDTGIGIDPAQIPRLFDRFARTSTHESQPRDGIGIGLWITRSLIELHDGSVTIFSAGLGLGTEVLVKLPRAPSIEVDTSEAIAAPAKERHPDRLALMIVDDAIENADTLSQLIKVLGHDPYACYDGLSAIEKVRQAMPDGIFLDIGMPNMDGLEVCRLIRKLPGGDRPYIVALTGWGQTEDRIKTSNAGFDFHATKPIDFEMVVQTLQKMGVRRDQIQD